MKKGDFVRVTRWAGDPVEGRLIAVVVAIGVKRAIIFVPGPWAFKVCGWESTDLYDNDQWEINLTGDRWKVYKRVPGDVQAAYMKAILLGELTI